MLTIFKGMSDEKPLKDRNFDSLSQATNALLEEGYKDSFVTKDGKFEAVLCKKRYSPEDLKVVQKFRFEGITNPSDQSTLMVIEACDGTRGTIITSYSYESNLDSELIKRIPDVC